VGFIDVSNRKLCAPAGSALSAYSFLAGFVALLAKTPLRPVSGNRRRAGIATFAAVLLAAIVLSDGRVQQRLLHRLHSPAQQPRSVGRVQVAVLWSGQEGSLLFWSLLLAGYGFVLRLLIRPISASSLCFGDHGRGAGLLSNDLNFCRAPFALTQGTIPADGNGLNPLLQYPECDPPPMLYLGYVGFTVPFAFALGALIMNYPGEKWIHITRRWTWSPGASSPSAFSRRALGLRCPWMGRLLGMGSGRKRSLMPWLTGTRFYIPSSCRKSAAC